MAVTAVTNEIDDHVLFKFLPVLQRQASDEQRRFRIVPVDMEHRRFDHFRHIAAIRRRACIL